MAEKSLPIKLGEVLRKKDGEGVYLKLNKYATVTITTKNKDGSEDSIKLSGENNDCLNMFKPKEGAPDFVRFDVVGYRSKNV